MVKYKESKNPKNKEQITILASGGGLTTAYHAGVIKAIQEKVGIDKIGRIVASSGAATTYSYFVSKQRDLIGPIWNYIVESKQFIQPLRNFSGRNILNIDFLIDEIIKKRFPLDLLTLKQSPISFEIGVTDRKTGNSKFYSKDSDEDFYEILRASCAVPYFYGKSVNLSDGEYVDGTIGDVACLNQIKDSDKKAVIVLTRPNIPIKKLKLGRKLLRWLLIRNEPLPLQEKIWNMPFEYNQLNEKINSIRDSLEVCVIQPKNRLPVNRIDISIDRLRKTIQQGYQNTIDSDISCLL